MAIYNFFSGRFIEFNLELGVQAPQSFNQSMFQFQWAPTAITEANEVAEALHSAAVALRVGYRRGVSQRINLIASQNHHPRVSQRSSRNHFQR